MLRPAPHSTACNASPMAVSGDQTPVRSHQGSLPWAEEKHRPAGDAVCALQYLDGQEDAFAKGAGMSMSANSQRAEMWGKHSLKWSHLAKTDTSVSCGETCSLMTGAQTAFWT